MKIKNRILIVFIACLGFSNSVLAQSKLESAFKSLIQAFKEENYKVINVADQTVTINSTSNAAFSGGKSKGAFKFTFPEGTKKYAVRVTVIPVKSNFQYEPDESFFSLIQKGSAREVAAPQNYGIDFYFFDRSYDVDGFLGNNNFNALWIIKNTNSFIESKPINPGNYWIGVKNPGSMNGLKAIVEVVAFGNF